MTKLEILKQETLLGREFNIYGDFENPLFLAKDVAEWIEHSNPTEMVRSIDEDEKLNSTILSSGQNRDVIVLTENGVYEVLMQSRKPIAKQFKKGVKEILHSIRKHGAYMTPQKIEEALLNPDTIIQLATNLKEEQQKRSLLEKENAVLKPKADFVDRSVDMGHLVDIGQTAKLLKLPFGRNTLFKELQEKGIFFKGRNEPKQEYIERGYFELREKEVPRDNHPAFMVTKVLVTQKGLFWLSKIFSPNPKASIPVLDLQ